MNAPIKDISYYTFVSGKAYKVAQDGDVLVAREYGVSMGEVRMFFYFSHDGTEQCMYFAEREFKPFWYPIIAPKIWWRKIKD